MAPIPPPPPPPSRLYPPTPAITVAAGASPLDAANHPFCFNPASNLFLGGNDPPNIARAPPPPPASPPSIGPPPTPPVGPSLSAIPPVPFSPRFPFPLLPSPFNSLDPTSPISSYSLPLPLKDFGTSTTASRNRTPEATPSQPRRQPKPAD
ncbi:hypothetical protein Mapa_002267 [Marchantia paleacea]|nr:hypothetical protein Mapa_002267 [Marchantia paleacea]